MEGARGVRVKGREQDRIEEETTLKKKKSERKDTRKDYLMSADENEATAHRDGGRQPFNTRRANGINRQSSRKEKKKRDEKSRERGKIGRDSTIHFLFGCHYEAGAGERPWLTRRTLSFLKGLGGGRREGRE